LKAVVVGSCGVALFLVACGIADTPQQNLAYARWAKCNSTSGTLERVDLDGRIIFRYTTAGDREEIVQCLAEAGRTGPPLPEPVGVRPIGGP
jgi:hypothetical protein